MSPEFAAEVTHSKCWGVLTHSPTPLKNTSILLQNLLHVKQPANPRHYWSKAILRIRHLSLKYKYKEATNKKHHYRRFFFLRFP
ncbi:hypothetical protein, partial [Escherichia coli]|uniref:hypothetical protein n=1 Tax=Escherichia coli TaxID=562 RepID=UPI001A7E0B48